MNNMANLLPMNPQYIEAHEVLVRYLAGQLSDAEREAFEAYYVEHPQMLQELEVAAKLKLGLALLQDAGELPAPRRWNWLQRLAAAAVLIAAIAAAAWFARPTPAPLLASAVSELGASQRPPTLAETYIIERTRNRGVEVRIELPSPARTLGLRVLPEHPSATYGLQLNAIAPGSAPREIASVQSLRADAQGLVSVYVDSARLQPGSYEIVLTADTEIAATAAASSFMVLVEPAKPQ